MEIICQCFTSKAWHVWHNHRHKSIVENKGGIVENIVDNK